MKRLRLPLALVALTIVLSACGGGDDQPDVTPTPERPTALDVLGQWVLANRNVDFVGLCADAQPGVDVGKVCATEAGTRGTRAAFHLGPTFSEATGLALLDETPEGWTVVTVQNRDPSAPNVPGIPWPLVIGDEVVVVGVGENDCLRVREQPTQQAAPVNCMADGTVAIVQEGPVEAETFTWWRIAGDGFSGWAAGTWLRLTSEIADVLNPNGAGEDDGTGESQSETPDAEATAPAE